MKVQSRYKYVISLSYLGTHYSGWQIQKNAQTVQGLIMDALHRIIDVNIPLVVGAGRTDSGVHAVKFFAHFESFQINLDNIVFKLNNFLPEDIVIHNIVSIDDSFHARYSALNRTYEYWINFSKDPFLINRSYFLHTKLDIAYMNEGAAMLIGRKDFNAFSKAKSSNGICDISSAFFYKSQNMLIFSIISDRFLYNMVRSLVGTLINLGLGKITLNNLELIIKSKKRTQAGYSVPAHGLYLVDIQYPKKYKIESI